MAARHQTHRPRETGPRDEDFRAYAERGDVEALARYFDAAAPRLMLVAAHVAPAGVEAEDLVQQTFLEALRGRYEPRDDASALTWLASILRRRAIDERRRAHRSREATLDEEHDPASAARGPDERLMDDETLALVVAAIDALEPPQREVVNMRLVLGHDPATIAHTLGRKPSTVRMQLKRGLERLREALPAGVGATAFAALLTDHGLAHAREAVLAEAQRLAPTLTPSGSSVGWAPKSIPLHPVTFMLALLAAVPLLASLLTGPSPEPSTTPTLPSIEPIEATAAIGVEPSASSRTELVADDANASPTGQPQADDDGSDDAPAIAVVTGRILRPDGAPALGVDVSWTTSRPIDDGLVSEKVEYPAISSDEDGRFTLEYASEGVTYVRVNARPAGHPDFELFFPVEASSPHLDIGDLRLSELGNLRVHALRPDGSPVEDPSIYWCQLDLGWQVHPRYHWDQSRSAPFDATGTATFFDVPIGACTTNLEMLVTGEALARAKVVVAADGWATADLVVDESALERRVTVVGYRDNEFGVRTDARSATLRLADGTELTASTTSINDIEFEDVPEGAHTLIIDEPAAELWTKEGVRAGDEIEVRLLGGSQVRLTVHDAQGVRLTDYEVSIRRPGSRSTVYPDVRPLATDTPTHELFAHVPSRTQTWIVAAEGHPTRSVVLEGLTRGEVRDVLVELVALEPITGTVSDADGAPLAGVVVEARKRRQYGSSFGHDAPLGSNPAPEARLWVQDQPDPVVTDADGRFAIAGVADGEYEVLAHRSRWNFDRVESCVAGDDLELTLAASRTISGRLEGPTPTQMPDLRLFATTDGGQVLRKYPGHDGRPVALGHLLADDGTFVIAHAPCTPIALTLAYEQRPASSTAAERILSRSFDIADVAAGAEDVVDLTVDVATHLPASVRITATRDGAPAAGLVLSGWTGSANDYSNQRRVSIELDAHGEARSTWVPPGAWTFALVGDGGLWSVPVGGVQHLTSGHEVELHADVATFPGTLTLLDGAGEPHVDARIASFCTIGGTSRSNSIATTDADGRLELTLPIGTYELMLRPWHPGGAVLGTSERVEVQWSTDGPLTPSIVLTPKGK